MPGVRLSTLVRRLRAGSSAGDGCTDAELLTRFVRSHDEAAFELLVWRHGAMVLAACRRVVRHEADAEDAFQAVFLVLARKARGVSRGTALPAWLHRVAVRISVRLAGSRRPVAPLETEPPAKSEADPAVRGETLGVLDQEIDRLPERFRRAVVLCYLEGLSAAEAAQRLGCPTGTVESRLAAARKKLRAALTRRGVTLPVGVLAVVGSQGALAPEAVARVTRAAAAFSLGDAAGLAAESPIKLAKGELAMWQTRMWAGVLLGASLLALGTGIGWANWPATQRPDPEAAAAELPTAPAPQAKGTAPGSGDAWPLNKRVAGVPGFLVGVAPDGRTLILNQGKDVYGLNLPRLEHSLTFHVQSQNQIWDAAVSPDGKYVATAEGVQGVKLRDAATGEVLEALWPSGKAPAQQVAFTPDGSRLVAVGTRSDDPQRLVGKGGGGFRDPDRVRDAKVTTQAQVSVWDVATRKELGHPVETTTVPQSLGVSARLPTYKLDKDGRFVLKTETLYDEPKPDPKGSPNFGGRLGQESGERIGFRLTVIDAVTGKAAGPVEVKEANLYPFPSSPLSPDGKTLLALNSANRNELRLLDASTGKERTRLSSLLRPVKVAAFSPDARFVAAASGRDPNARDELAAPSEVVIWDASSGKELARLTDKESIRNYTALRFSPDGSFLVAQEEAEGGLTIWGHPPKPEPEATKPPEPKKEPAPKPPAPAGVPDRFQALFQSLSAADVTDPRRVEAVFLAALGRLPTDVESRTLAAQFARQTDKSAALCDLLNTLVDTDEFKAHAEALRKLSK
jgi:RNA polymerase sigma factor (sigma-70 family)